jgi:hypothetical protein
MASFCAMHRRGSTVYECAASPALSSSFMRCTAPCELFSALQRLGCLGWHAAPLQVSCLVHASCQVPPAARRTALSMRRAVAEVVKQLLACHALG